MFDRIGEALSSLDDFLSLKRPLAADSAADEDDVLSVKKNLNRSGYYDEPDYGMTPYPDKPLFDGIRTFQKDNDLTIDGVMNPGGETETALNWNRIVQSAPPVPPRKPEIKDEIRLKAEDQGEFVGDLFANMATGKLKRLPIKNPLIRKALSKALGASEEIISFIPEKLWTSIAEKQMRERRNKTDE